MAFPPGREVGFRDVVKARVNRWSCDVALPNYPDRVGDAEMRLLPAFARVVRVRADPLRMLEAGRPRSRITSDGLKTLSTLKELDTLHLPGITLSDADLELLGNINSLRDLDLSEAFLYHDAVRHLGNLDRLRRLSLAGTNLSDPDCIHLAQLKALTALDLFSTAISTAGIKRLASLTNLTWLDLSGTEVDDEGIQYLKQFRKLTYLGLGSSRVTPKRAAILESYLSAGVLEYKSLPEGSVVRRRFTTTRTTDADSAGKTASPD
jgi:hypothetical protein